MPTIHESEEQYRQTILERIKKKTVYDGDCWRYTGKHVGNGYASITYRDRDMRLNRFIAWMFHKMDRYDKDIVAAHKPECRFRDCWNPDHIYVATHKENVADQIAAGTFHAGTENLLGHQRSRERARIARTQVKSDANNG